MAQAPFNLTFQQIANLTDYQKMVLLSKEAPKAPLHTPGEKIPLKVTFTQVCRLKGIPDEKIDALWEERRKDWEK